MTLRSQLSAAAHDLPPRPTLPTPAGLLALPLRSVLVCPPVSPEVLHAFQLLSAPAATSRPCCCSPTHTTIAGREATHGRSTTGRSFHNSSAPHPGCIAGQIRPTQNRTHWSHPLQPTLSPACRASLMHSPAAIAPPRKGARSRVLYSTAIWGCFPPAPPPAPTSTTARGHSCPTGGWVAGWEHGPALLWPKLRA